MDRRKVLTGGLRPGALAISASLQWREATALRRCDLDLGAATVPVRASYVERSTGATRSSSCEDCEPV